MRSNRHESGFALRFPRIAALRPDKTADEIDTVETVTALYEGLQHGAEHLVTAGAKPTGVAGRAATEPRPAQRSTGRSSRLPHSAQPPS